MSRAVILIFFAFICMCGGLPPRAPRIVGGLPAPIEFAPFQVSILDILFDDGVYHHSFGGAIVTENAILSVGHLIRLISDKPLLVRAGSAINNVGGVTRFVKEVIPHPLYEGGFDYDFSVLILEEPLPLETGPTAKISKIKMAEEGSEVPAGVMATATGWGAMEESASWETELRYVDLPVVDSDDCRERLFGFGNITESMMCAGDAGGGDVCYGDNGGPLTFAGVLRGLSSWGFGCAREGYPHVFSKIAWARRWIDRVLANNSYVAEMDDF